MKKFIRIFGLALVLAGCASVPVSKIVDGADISPVATERVAVSYHMVNPRINYTETLFRGLWLENKASTQDFSGVWMPDADLSGLISERLRAQGFKAESVHGLTSAGAIAAASRDVGSVAEKNSAMMHPSLPAVKLLAPELFFAAPPGAADFAALSGELRAKGIRYLVQLTTMDLHGNAPGYGMVIITSAPNMRVIDLQTNKVVWNANTGHAEVFQLGGDLKKLEENGMAKAKEGMKLSVAKMDFVKLLNVTPR